MRAIALIAAGLVLASCSPPAEDAPASDAPPIAATAIQVQMTEATLAGPGQSVGFVVVRDSSEGAVFALNLTGLPPGEHGFHVHETASCQPGSDNGDVAPAGAAGGHWDPDGTGQHLGPYGEGHLGDLPVLQVSADGTAQQSLTAPRIEDIERLRGHALMVHAQGDNFSDQPEPLGGGGARIACGLIQ